MAVIAIVAGILLLAGSWAHLPLDDRHGAWSSVILSIFPDALAEVYGVLGLTAVGNIGDTADLELSGASGIATFESGGTTYAAVASTHDYGVQILNLTDPANPVAAGSIVSTASVDLELAGANNVAIFESGGTTYAAVTASMDDGVQIISLADPANPVAAGSIINDSRLNLDDPRGIAIYESGGTTYAAVASYGDDGLQILNLTDPANPVAAGRIGDTASRALDGSSSVAIYESDGTTYAAVTGSIDDGVQIISLADPANPAARGSITDTAGLVLDGANDIAIFTSSGTTYAAVAAFNDGGVQIIRLTNQDNPAALGSIEDDRSLELRGSNAITMFEAGGTTYVAVAAYNDNGVQIISLADPANPVAAANINNTPDLKLKNGSGITTFESGGTTYVAVAAKLDNGVQIFSLNHSPSASAGSDLTVGEGDTVTLSGTASDADSDPLTYAWTHDQPGLGISLANDTALLTTFTAPEVTADTTVIFTLTASDGTESASDAVSVTIYNNFLPEFSAGQDQTVYEGDTVTLSGIASDADSDPLTYAWTHDQPGLGISLANDTALLTTFTAPEVTADTTVIFTLTASDGTESASDAVSVTIYNNYSPTVSAGQDQTTSKGDTVTLSGTASDADSDPLTYAWTHDQPGLGISLANDTALLTTFTAPEVTADTTVIFTLTASDGTESASDAVSVTIYNNYSPTVSAGQDQTVDEGDTVTLSGIASDADSDPLTYAWTHDQPGLGISLANDTALLTTFTAPEVTADTTVIFTLTASDGTESASDAVSVTIKHVPDPYNPDKAFVTTWQTDMAGQSITIPVGGTSGTYTADWGDGTTSMNVTGDQTHVYDDAGTYTVKIYGDFTRIVLSGNSANAKKLQSIDQWGDTQWSSMKSAFHGASNMAHRATDAPDLSDVTNTSYMFYKASSFNGDLSDWDVSSVTTMSHMFDGASSFNSDLSDWDVSSVTNTSYMFYEASSFNGDLSDWDVSSVTNMVRMFGSASSFNGDLSDWDVSKVTNMLGMFAFTPFNGDLSDWDVSKVTNMSGMFAFARQFDSDLSDWDVSSVTDMSTMFDEADSFNGDLSDWDVSSVTDMYVMFYGANSFNGNISTWNVSSVTNMSRMFNQAFSFNGNISGWNLSSIETMGGMFYRADKFKQNLGNWYIVPGSTSIDYDEAPGVVGRISAQNSDLNGQNPVYRIGSGGDSDSFEINAKKLTLKTVPIKSLYSVTVTATGDFGTSNSKTVTVTVTGVPSVLPPTVDAGTDQTVVEGQTATLNGTVTNVSGGSLTYLWSHDSSLDIQLANSTSPSTTFTAPEVTADTTVTFTLTADDGTASSSDAVSVTISNNNNPPTVDAGSDQTVGEGNTVTLSGTASDADSDPLAYTWTHDRPGLGISLTNGTAILTTFTAPAVYADTEITFTLTADDGSATVADSLVVTVTDVPAVNSPPVADAGSGQIVHENQTATLSGTATDVNGDLLTYSWSHDSTLTIPLTNSTSPSTTFTAPAVDADTDITFTLTADDGSANSTDTVLVTVLDADDSDFVTTWETTAPGESITIPARGKYAVYWGDGTVDANVRHSQTHEYDAPGNHTVRISKGIMGINLNNHADASKLQSIDQWGDTKWRSMQSSFKGASNMVLHATDAPDLSRTTDMSYMFMHAGSFDGDLSDWDVSGVTGMTGMFYGANSFDGNISAWDVSGVTGMTAMFYNANSFTSDLSGWNVSGVTEMTGMFSGARSFTSDLSGWDVSGVTDMSSMFSGARSFDGNISAWDVSGVTDMSSMFSGARSFDGNISAWDVSGATDMTRMFSGADSFDQNLGPWYVVLDDVAIDSSDIPGEVGRIAAQNSFLDGQTPAYGISSGGDSAHFEIDGGILRMISIADGHEGPYSVTITSTGGFGTGNSRTFDIGISGFADNAPPSVDAGQSQTADEGDTVTLSGTASDSNYDSLTYMWSHDSTLAIQLANSTSPSTTFTAPAVDADTEITFTLTADDGTTTATDSLVVTVTDVPAVNSPPVADAGLDQAVQEGQAGTLNGTATDDDGDPLTYAWTHDSSLAIQLANSTSPSTTFTAPAVDADTEITFTLTADDGTTTATDSLVVTVTDVPAVNSPPVADAGLDQAVQEGQAGTLNGTATDDDGDPLTYAWTHDSSLAIQLANSTSPSTTFTAPAVDADTEITFTLTADDGTTTATDSLVVTVTDVPAVNSPPVADAGLDQAVQEGQAGTLNGTATDDDGDPLTYAWTHDSSLAIQLANSTSPSTTFTAPAVDADTEITFTLTADDGTTTATDSLVVTVTDVPAVNSPPVADAGLDQAVQEGQAGTLNGTATDDDGDPLTYAWTHDSSLAIQLANSTSPSTTFTAPAVDADTEITFTLTADDGTTNSTDTVLVTVSDVSGDSDFVTTWETTAPGESITIPARGKYTIDWGDGMVDANVRHSQTHAYDAPGNHTVRISKGITVINLNNHADAPKLQSIDRWGDTKWRSMQSSFKGASNMILHATDAPDLSRTTDMSYMFMHAGFFDGDLSGWDVSGVTGMTGMFYNANSFNGDLSGWDVSGVTGMTGMFYGASSFDGNISAWDVSGVTDMPGMFYGANSFTSDLSGWDVSGVTDMSSMFSGASSFDGNISAWDVSGVTDMSSMFSGADSFEQNLGPWYVVLDDVAIDSSDIPGEVGRIAAQNSFLDGQNPAYGIGSGGDSSHFEIDGDILRMTSIPDGHEGPYSVTITSTGGFGTGNSRTFDISVTGGTGNTPPVAPPDPRGVGQVTVSSTQPGTIQIDWEAPSEQPREYRVTWAKSGEAFPNWRDTVGNAFPTGTSQTVTSLEEGEEYQVKVRARYDSGGPGDWSDTFTITVS